MAGVHIVMMGPMGVGKTTTGRAVADAIGRPFDDSDSWIERRFATTAALIASERGVAALHRVEADHAAAALAAAALAATTPSVISIAASAIEDDRVVAALTRSFGILLLAPTDALGDRIACSGRRDLGADRLGAIEALTQTRLPMWRAVAKATIDTTIGRNETVDAVLEAIDG